MCERLDSVLPFGWSLKTLSDIAIDENGIVDGPFGSNLKVSDYVDDAENGVPVLTTKNLSGDYSRGTLRYVTKDKYDTLKRSTVFPGDILVAKIGSIGKCGIYPLTQKKALIPANLLKITLKEEYDRKFVFYYIQSGQFQKLIKSISTATAQPAFNVTKFRKLPVIIPPLEEQKRIVARIEELFSELDAAVATLERTKEQLAVYRQAVLKEAFENIEETTELDSLANMIDPQPSHRTPPEVVGGIPYVGIGDIDYNTRKIDFNNARKVSLSVLHEHLDRYTLQTGDFIMGKIGTIGKPYVIPSTQNYTLSANVILIQPDRKKINPSFLYWQFSSPYIIKQLDEGAKATTQSAFGIKKARKLLIKICSFEMQESIVAEIDSRLSVCDKIDETVNTALEEAEAMRQSILKQAFTGEL